MSEPAAAESSRVMDRAPPAAGGWAPPQAPKRRRVSCSALLGGAGPFQVDDVADALAYRDDEEFTRFLPHIPRPFTPRDAEAFVR